MFQTIKLLLPALIPSWRFFKTIQPSPRVQWQMLREMPAAEDQSSGSWREFRPRPQSLSLPAMVGRMFWNANWNESLYLVSLAERITTQPTSHSVDEVFRRVENEIVQTISANERLRFLRFRLVFVYRDKDQLVEEITYLSPVRAISGDGQ